MALLDFYLYDENEYFSVCYLILSDPHLHLIEIDKKSHKKQTNHIEFNINFQKILIKYHNPTLNFKC